MSSLEAFVRESNAIEGIYREPTEREVQTHRRLLALDVVTVADLEWFVADVAARPLRIAVGQNVRVGPHVPPPGGPAIKDALEAILNLVNAGRWTPYEAHREYESLHPFIDGNGRSGRALWAWQMQRDGRDPFALPFLHRWYYDSLDAGRRSPQAVVEDEGCPTEATPESSEGE